MKSPTSNPSAWQAFIQEPDLKVISSSRFQVNFAIGRSHMIHVEEDIEGWRLRAVVASHPQVDDLFQWAALVNRGLTLLGLEVDAKGVLIGSSWVPKIGLTATEFQMLARQLAAECDRLEFALTGLDRE